MESSTVIAFRAMVMLACLIVVPLAAIFGSQFPDVVKSVLIDRFWPANEKPAAAEPLAHEAPPFSAASAPAWNSDAPPAAASGFAPAANRTTLPASPAAIEPTSAWNASDGQVRHAMHEIPTGPPAAGPREGGSSAPPFGGAASAVPVSPSPAQTDRFTWMERRLREYGATYYLLETWANGGNYRFFCQMSLANNPGRTHNFEATDTDPLRAMGRVVDQVEAWRAGRVQ